MLQTIKDRMTLVLTSFRRHFMRTENQNWPIDFARALGEFHSTAGGRVEAIVFSKDRTMQLHAFLASYLDRIANPVHITILYRASTDDHVHAYRELEELLESPLIRFIPETNFRDDLMTHASNTSYDKILLFVDDIIFKEAFDFEALTQIDTGKHILSLTRGRDLTYSSVLQKPIHLPTLTPAFGQYLCFSWRGEEFSDWTFPLGVSGYMFGRCEWLAMLQTLDFRAPNSLEAALQKFVPIYEMRQGLCTERAICVCVHANMVQSELPNPTLGNFSIDALLNTWRQGLMIDRVKFYNKDLTIAEKQDYGFVPRA